MARTVSGPSQATVHLARKTPQEIYNEGLDEGEAWQFSIPRLLYKRDMQARFAAARATVLQFTLSVPIIKKTSSPYSNSDDDSDGPPPSPKRTDATEMKIDESLQIFINVSTRIRKIPVQEIFQEMAPIPGNVRTYPKVCVGKHLEYR